MGKKIVFEGKIDGAYSQIFFDESRSKWLMMQRINPLERKKARNYVRDFNRDKTTEDRLYVVRRMYKDKPSDFLLGEIPERLARSLVRQNQANQIPAGTNIRPVPKYSEQSNSYLNKRSKLFNLMKTPLGKVGVTATALALAGTMLVASVVPSFVEKGLKKDIPEAQNITISQTVEKPTIQESNRQEATQTTQKIELEDIELSTQTNGSLTSESVRNLTGGIVNELGQLYENAGGELPSVIESETLASLFYVENTCKPEDSKDNFVGIGQMGKIAVKTAITRADKLFKAASNKNNLQQDSDNYIVNNICSKGRDIEALTLDLWEQAKTDPKICGVLTGLYLADLSDRYESTIAGNKAAVIMMYNAGEGNFSKYRKLGIVDLDTQEDKMTIDVSNVNKLQTESELEKYNEAENYVIKVLEGSKRLKENSKSDVNDVCEQVRLDVGKNNNYAEGKNTQQYSFKIEGLEIIGVQSEHGVQPGQ